MKKILICIFAIILLTACKKNNQDDWIPDCSLSPEEIQKQVDEHFGFTGLKYNCRNGTWSTVIIIDSLQINNTIINSK